MENFSLSEWIRHLEVHGINTFSFEKVRETFPNASEQNLLNSLYRLTVKKRIVSVYKSFYVIISPQYAAKGIVAPVYYIDQLMEYIGDLIQYEKHIGGLSRAATVLEELTEQADFLKVSNELLDYTSVTAIQRLGFILENILEQNQQADILYEQLRIYGKRLNYVPLSTRSANKNIEKDTRWKIYINIEIETDDL